MAIWPVHGVCNVAVIAAMKSVATCDHYRFKLAIGFEMTLPFVRQRAMQQQFTFKIKRTMIMVGIVFDSPATNTSLVRRRRCDSCVEKGTKDRKHSFRARIATRVSACSMPQQLISAMTVRTFL